MDIQAEMKKKAEAAKGAAAKLALLGADVKNKALLAMADALEKRSEVILQANALDIEDARQKKVKRSYLDRLLLDEGRIASMAEGLRQTAALPDPVATGDYSTVRPNGLEIRRVRVPLGVIGIIYEARPNVTADAAVLRPSARISPSAPCLPRLPTRRASPRAPSSSSTSRTARPSMS